MMTINRPLTIITALAAVLRFSTLGIESLWYDETFTAWLAQLPLNRLIAATLGDVHPPTWYLVEWGMVNLFGSDPVSLRLVSGLAGVALVPAMYYLALAFGLDRARSLAAAALAAIAPFFIYFSQEARAYSLIYLLTTLTTLFMLKRRWVGFVVTAVLALYLHNLTALYIAALAWLALYRWGLDWRKQAAPLAALSLSGMFWLPWLVWGLLGQVSDVSDSFWIRPPTLGTPLYILVCWFFSNKSLSLVMVTAPLVAIGLLLGLTQNALIRPVKIQLLGLLLIPLGLCAIISQLVAPVLVDRVIGSSAIALLILLASGLPAQWPRPHFDFDTLRLYAWPACVALVVVTILGLWYTTDRMGRYPWNYHLDDTLNRMTPTDGMFHANLATYIVLRYYLPDVDQYVWQQANDLSQSLTNESKWAMDMDQAQFEDVICKHPRWWLAFYENPTTSDNERAEIARIVKKYNGQQISTILKNDLVNARTYLLENPCKILTAAK